MDLIAFLPQVGDPADPRWLQTLAANWQEGRVETYATPKDLANRLGQPHLEPFLLLLHLPEPGHLERMLELRELLADRPIICILPDDNPATMAKGHLLRPRLLLTQVEPSEIIKQVLRKFQRRVIPSI